MENQLIKRSLIPEIRAVNAESRSIEFVISTERVDTYGTVFKIDGWNLDAYRSNPIVSYNHQVMDSDPDTIIGTSEVRVEDKQLVATLTLEEGNPVADKVLRKLQNGTLRGASIGAIIHEGRWGKKEFGEDEDTIYFTRMDLIEWSVVSIPSNPDAKKRSALEENVINSITKPKQENNSRAESRDDIKARISILTLT